MGTRYLTGPGRRVSSCRTRRDRGRRLAAPCPWLRWLRLGPTQPRHGPPHRQRSVARDGWPDVNYCTFNDEDAPLCNLYLNRGGTVWVCAGGATNTNGSGSRPVRGHQRRLHEQLGHRHRGREQRHRRDCGPTPNWTPTSRWCDSLCVSLRHPDLARAQPPGVGTQSEGRPSRTGPLGERQATWNMDDFRGDVSDRAPTPPDPQPPTPDGDDELNQDQANELHAAYLNSAWTWEKMQELMARMDRLEGVGQWNQDTANEVHQTFLNSDYTWQKVEKM